MWMLTTLDFGVVPYASLPPNSKFSVGSEFNNRLPKQPNLFWGYSTLLVPVNPMYFQSRIYSARRTQAWVRYRCSSVRSLCYISAPAMHIELIDACRLWRHYDVSRAHYSGSLRHFESVLSAIWLLTELAISKMEMWSYWINNWYWWRGLF